MFGDADILIARGDHRRAIAALGAAGFTRFMPPVHLWWERRFGKTAHLRAPSGGELDLHFMIAPGYFGERIDHDRIWNELTGWRAQHAGAGADQICGRLSIAAVVIRMQRCYSACMVSIAIRDVPDATRDELAARAARSGRSLQEYLRSTLIDVAARPDIDTVLARIADRKRVTKSLLDQRTILDHRDADRT